jgi:hypothetical protein
MLMAADGLDHPPADVFWTLVLFFARLVQFWLVLTVLGDLFRRHDVSGPAGAGWVVAVLVPPLLAPLTYLGRRRPAPGDPARLHGGDEVAGAKRLLDGGAISREEFEQLERRALA